jgi:hypothetical protein
MLACVRVQVSLWKNGIFTTCIARESLSGFSQSSHAYMRNDSNCAFNGFASSSSIYIFFYILTCAKKRRYYADRYPEDVCMSPCCSYMCACMHVNVYAVAQHAYGILCVPVPVPVPVYIHIYIHTRNNA